jgi:hypothetical protein
MTINAKALHMLWDYFGADFTLSENGDVHVSFFNHSGFSSNIFELDMDEVKAAIQEDKDQQRGEN